VRRLAAQHAVTAGLADRATDVALVASELATNSVRHGGGGGALRLWRQAAALICEVRDHGHVVDPLVGRRRPVGTQIGGRGLWVVNQLCDLVQVRSSTAGTTVRVHICSTSGERGPSSEGPIRVGRGRCHRRVVGKRATLSVDRIGNGMNASSGPDGLPTDELGGQEILVISSWREATRVVMTLTGELDITGTGRLATEVQRALTQTPIEALEIDLRGLSFADSSGLQAILTACETTRLAGVTFLVVGVSPVVSRVIHIAGVDNILLPTGEHKGPS
jgi:anti-anti-sigma factor